MHFLEKAVNSSIEVEWAMRLYNQTNPNRHSRLSFYTFKLVSPPGQGNGAYRSMASRRMTRRLSSWAAGFSSWGKRNRRFGKRSDDRMCLLEAGRRAAHTPADKYEHSPYHVHATRVGANQHRRHQFVRFQRVNCARHNWNGLVSAAEITSIWAGGEADLRGTPMYHSYV